MYNQIEIFKKLASPKVRKFDLVLLHSQIRVYEVKIKTPKLKRAVTRNSATGKYEIADYRISKRYFL